MLTPKSRTNSLAIPLQGFFLYSWLVNLQNTDSYHSVYLLIAIFAAFSLYENHKCHTIWYDRAFGSVIILSALFGFAMVLANYQLFVPCTALLNLANAFCTFLGGSIAFFHIFLYLLHRLPVSVNTDFKTHPLAVFLLCFILIAAYNTLYLFFHAYPGFLSTDSFSTIRQILTGAYNNIMPYWHTKTVEVFFRLGCSLFGDINAAVATVSFVQVLFMAFCFSYGIMTLYQTGTPYRALVLILIGYVVLPYHTAYSATLWKDVPFSGAALLVAAALLRIIRNVGSRKWQNYLIFILGCAGLSLWRTNGWYALAAIAVVIAIIHRKRYKALLIMMGVVLLVSWILISPLLGIMNIQKSDFVEALAIPFQQIGRVVATDCPLTQQEEEILSEVLVLDLVKENYDPQIVDPIKFHSMRSPERLKSNLPRYAALWLKLGFKYPAVYLQAWIEATKGYWNGGYEYWIYMYHTDANPMGIVQTDGQNVISALFRAVERYLQKPDILKPLFSIGLSVWTVLICCYVNIKKKREEYLIALPVLVIVAGLLIGAPVYAEFRYAYPVFTTLPVIVCSTIFQQESKPE